MRRDKDTTVGHPVIPSLIAAVASLFGCSQAQPPAAPASQVAEELEVSGFDPDGEPVIRTSQDGSITIVFEAMPPFFAEENGTEADFEKFEETMSQQLGLPVEREDREVFIIRKAPAGTAERIRQWLSTFHERAE